ncbi:putative T7SS-secreted protein [Streptomyces sp. NPDC026672]|uniref:putative T7SS-secreted protein n=1 Tax=unclassified Streptomyces TaxID=2593676 RepID=UPI0033EA35D9
MGLGDLTNSLLGGAEDLYDAGRKKVGEGVDWATDKVGEGLDHVGAHDWADSVEDWGDEVASDLGATPGEQQLGQTEEPDELVHGKPDRILESAKHLRDFNSAFDKVGSGLKKVDSAGWTGEGGDAFRKKFGVHPAKWAQAADACEAAAGALESYAGTVKWAQGQAKEAVELYKKGVKASKDATDAYNNKVDAYNAKIKANEDPGPKPEPFEDPGKADIKAAAEKLAEARKQRNTAGSEAQGKVKAALAHAPAEPPPLERLGSDFVDGYQAVNTELTHVVGGALKGTAGLLNFARGLNPTDPYNLTHPADYLQNVSMTLSGLVSTAAHPERVVQAAVDGFKKDPSEFVGRLIPELIGTKGAGLARGGLRLGLRTGLKNGLEEGAEAGVRREARAAAEREPQAVARVEKDKVCVDDPVDVATGRMILAQTDLAMPGSLPLVFTRTFESSYRAGRWFGISWASTLDQRLEIDVQGVVLVAEDGSIQTYPHPAPEVPVLPAHGRRRPLVRTPDGFTVTDPESGHVRHFTDDGRLVQVDDRNGGWIAYDYDGDGVPTGIRHSGGYEVRITVRQGRIASLSLADGTRILDYGYRDGHLTEVVNSSGKPLRFGYDDEARIVSWTDTNGHCFDYVYDERHRCVSQSGSEGHVNSRFRYEEGTTTVQSGLGHVRRYGIDTRAHVVSETDANGATTYFARDGFNRLVRRTDPLGRTTAVEYDGEGRVTVVTRPDGRSTTVEYNVLGLPVLVTRPDGSRVRREYDERGNLTSVTGPSGTFGFTYDPRGHVASTTDPAGRTTRIRCNEAGLPVETVAPSGGVTRHTYDAFGRPVSVTGPLGETTRLTWSAEGRLLRRTDPDGGAHEWAYDGEGNVLAHVGPDGARTSYEYGAFDRLTARTEPDGARFEFDHDIDLRLRRVVDPRGLTWMYTYDPSGRLTSETDFDGRTLHYAYDPAGQLTARTNAAGQTVHYAYTAIGQLARKDVGGAVTSYEYDFFGELTRASGPDVTLTRLRDRSGLLRSETVDGRALTFDYDELGRVTRRTTPTGAVSELSYDLVGAPAGLMASGHTLTFRNDGAGRELARIFGPVTLSHDLDVLGRPVEQWLTGPDGHVLRQRGYQYRPDGHLVAVETGGERRDFTLDAVGRATAVTASDWEETYTYDAAGNQTEASWPDFHPDAAAATGRRTYDRNGLVSAGRLHYEYDAQGRVTLRRKDRLSRKPDTWRFTWDAEDRLTGLTTPDGTVWRYLYDPLGRRTSKQRLSVDGEVVEETLFTWEGSVLCEQTTVSRESPGAVVLTWDHRDLHPVAQRERLLSASQEEIDSRFFAVVTDLVGTPTELVDERGAIAWRTRTTLWGLTTWNRDASAYTPLRFPGQYFDPESGLHHNVFRTYDPESARYLSPDPLGLAPAPNPAAYVRNPLTWSDHLGLAPDQCTVTVYRKQTQHPLSQRVHVDENGNVTVTGNNQLYVNMSGDIKHTIEFRGDGGQIVSFEVPKGFVEDIRREAVPQKQPDGLGFTKQEWKQLKKYYPEISDPTMGPDLYGLPGDVIEKMRKVIIPGSGRIVQDFE